MILNYQKPKLRPAQLREIARRVKDDFGAPGTVADEILFYAMDFNVIKMLRQIQKIWDHYWLSLHFADLVYAGGVFSSVPDVLVDLRYFKSNIF